LPIIRSAKVENILIDDFDEHQNLYTSASYLYLCWLKALTCILQICCVLFTSVILVRFLIIDTDISAAHVGLVLSQAAILRKCLNLTLYNSIKIETEATSVERILEYTKQDQEHGDGILVEGWPQQGEIKFNNVYLSYDSDNYVLRNLNFTVKPQEIIGIVGRTAAGKSSILSTILRLHKFEGKIFIDGVDIATLPLETLRSNVSVISQEPALFTGTVRENIDLAGKYADAEIWNALKVVKLEMLFSSLDYRISTVDSNLSLGQKQLLCLARAIIRNSKIVIMDEVTASVDQETERMIHKIVVEEFACCTVILITHKFDYVLEYDKVMVLDNGSVVEFDRPSILLDNVNGLFHKMFRNPFKF
jgi:ATP-binding cassette subfamily C (CFTR/MRP) protein 4